MKMDVYYKYTRRLLISTILSYDNASFNILFSVNASPYIHGDMVG